MMLHKLKRLALLREPKYAAHTYRSFDAAAAIYCRIERSCSSNGCKLAELVKDGVLEMVQAYSHSTMFSPHLGKRVAT